MSEFVHALAIVGLTFLSDRVPAGVGKIRVTTPTPRDTSFQPDPM
jgi:hypothetical protein